MPLALFTVYHGDGNNQQEDQHEGYSQEEDVCRRSGHGVRMSLEKTEVMWVGHHRE